MKGISWTCDLTAKEYVDASSFHKETDPEFLKRAVKLMKEKPHEITTGCTNFGKLIKKRANVVLREIHLLSAYMRLQPYPEMLLVGHCEPGHFTCFPIAKSLARRFDRFLILIFTPNNYALATQRTDLARIPRFKDSSEENIIEKIRRFSKEQIMDSLSADIILEGGDFLWEKYYETQYLEQRINKRMFNKLVPKYAMKKANMRVEKDFYEKITDKSRRNKKLDSFF